MSIKLKSVYKRHGKEEVLSGINLEISDGEFLVIKGKDEETKVFLDVLRGVEKVTSGTIVISGYDVKTMKKRERRNLYQTVFGVVSQDFQDNISIMDNISLPGFFADMSKIERKTRVKTMAKNLGLSEILTKKPSSLTKSLFVKAMVARACFMNPKIILANEPTKNLNSDDSKVLLSLLKNFSKTTRATIIITSNDNNIEKFATKVLKFSEGKLV